jgi:hypothetical protein
VTCCSKNCGVLAVGDSANVRAGAFARRELFLAVPDEGFPVASLAARVLADAFCRQEGCSKRRRGEEHGCHMHGRIMAIGLAKLIATGEVIPELSKTGVLYVRLSPEGVLAPVEWHSLPAWWDRRRPEMMLWAAEVVAEQIERDNRRNGAQRVAERWGEEV